MKQIFSAFLLITVIGLTSCRKTDNQPDIKQYDQTQIQNFIKANSLTGMQRDTTKGDTTGIYYQILSPGSGPQMEYSDNIAFVYSAKTFDGKYGVIDTLNIDHYQGFLGHVNNNAYPKCLQDAIHDLIKYRGASARLLIPSRLAYGINGLGSGSTKINSNQCLDYYVHVIKDQQKYDDFLIKQYMVTHNLDTSSYQKVDTSGIYYKVLIPGTGFDKIGDFSSFTSTYTGKYLNDVAFDTTSETTATSLTIESLVAGVQKGLKGQTAGASISLFIPSRFGYGVAGNSSSGVVTIGPNVVLHFEFQLQTVTNP